jgi:hypothetical protein
MEDFFFYYRRICVRLGGGWLRLIYCERKILLVDWWLVADTELV